MFVFLLLGILCYVRSSSVVKVGQRTGGSSNKSWSNISKTMKFTVGGFSVSIYFGIVLDFKAGHASFISSSFSERHLKVPYVPFLILSNGAAKTTGFLEVLNHSVVKKLCIGIRGEKKKTQREQVGKLRHPLISYLRFSSHILVCLLNGRKRFCSQKIIASDLPINNRICKIRRSFLTLNHEANVLS